MIMIDVKECLGFRTDAELSLSPTDMLMKKTMQQQSTA